MTWAISTRGRRGLGGWIFGSDGYGWSEKEKTGLATDLSISMEREGQDKCEVRGILDVGTLCGTSPGSKGRRIWVGMDTCGVVLCSKANEGLGRWLEDADSYWPK